MGGMLGWMVGRLEDWKAGLTQLAADESPRQIRRSRLKRDETGGQKASRYKRDYP